MYKQEFEKKEDILLEDGQMGATVETIVGFLFVFIFLAVIVVFNILSGTLAGKTYQEVEADLDAITNLTIRESVKSMIVSSFEAQEDGADLLPIVVLALVMFSIIGLILTFGLGFIGGVGGVGGRGGVAL